MPPRHRWAVALRCRRREPSARRLGRKQEKVAGGAFPEGFTGVTETGGMVLLESERAREDEAADSEFYAASRLVRECAPGVVPEATCGGQERHMQHVTKSAGKQACARISC